MDQKRVRIPSIMATTRPLTLTLALALAACGEPDPGPGHCPQVAAADVPGPLLAEAAPGEVSPGHLRAWVDALASPALEGRHATSDQGRSVALMLAESMAALGLTAPFDGSFCQGFAVQGGLGLNVVGHLAGSGTEAVLVGAHYDGQGLHPAGLLFPSADDNASGVAALLEVARLAAERSWPFDLVFVAFGAEELGRLGSEAWVREPTAALPRLRLMVNFDMVGRSWPGSPPEAIGYQALGTSPEAAAARLAAAGAGTGVAIRPLTELFTEDDMISDSTVFSRYAPTLYLSTGLHDDHHQRTDTAERVNELQIARAVRLTMGLLEGLAED